MALDGYVISRAGVLVAVAGCSGEVGGPPQPVAGAARVDRAVPVLGIPNRGFEPAIVAIEVAGQPVCSGALIAADVVLTARHCVSIAGVVDCPGGGSQALDLQPADSLAVKLLDGVVLGAERAKGRELLVPPGHDLCGADVALVMLDRPIEDVAPLAVHAVGAASGEHVRTAGLSAQEIWRDPAPTFLRDHVPVLDGTDAEFRIAEGPSRGGSIAVEEGHGEIVGVSSRPGPDGNASSIYTRLDPFMPLVGRALAQGAPSVRSHTQPRKAKNGPADMGAACEAGGECAAGVCVTDGAKRYCSRVCGGHDHCPAHFRCQRGRAGPAEPSEIWVCVEK